MNTLLTNTATAQNGVENSGLTLLIPRVKYDPAVHSRNRLLRQIEAVSRHHENPLLIGSLGRAAAMGTEQEFNARGETSEQNKKGLARDIDLFLPNGKRLAFPTDPFPVDTTAITAHDERIVIENGDYWLVDDLLGCAVALDADVFAPCQQRLFGELEVMTFSARTHFALLYVMFDDPSKYAIARRLMQSYLAAASPADTVAELYEPFAEFYRQRRRSLLNRARCMYRRAVPLAMRSSFVPLVRRLKGILPDRNALSVMSRFRLLASDEKGR